MLNQITNVKLFVFLNNKYNTENFILVFSVWCLVFGALCPWHYRVWCLERFAFGIWGNLALKIIHRRLAPNFSQMPKAKRPKH